MEILELLFVLVQGCGCVLEVLAALGWAGAGGAGLQARKKLKERRAANVERAAKVQEGVPLSAQEQKEVPFVFDRTMVLFLALLALAVVLTGLAFWKWFGK
jgi:hypothetical protein